jgi:hypothetical protein
VAETLSTYLNRKFPSKVYLCAWPSQDRLRREIKCRASDLGDALRALETEGDIIVTPRRGRKTSIIAIRLKPNSADHEEVTAPPHFRQPRFAKPNLRQICRLIRGTGHARRDSVRLCGIGARLADRHCQRNAPVSRSAAAHGGRSCSMGRGGK